MHSLQYCSLRYVVCDENGVVREIWFNDGNGTIPESSAARRGAHAYVDVCLFSLYFFSVTNISSLEEFIFSAVVTTTSPPLLDFIGNIPSSIGKLTNLKVIRLIYNQLSGTSAYCEA